MTLLESAFRFRNQRRRINKGGFTLIEILVVIVIIALLATTVGPAILNKVGQARTATAKDQVASLTTALHAYMMENGHYPTTQQGLQALWELPSIDAPATWRGPYLQKTVPLDPWGKPYYYVSPGEVNPTSFDLYTLGKDGLPGGEVEDPDNADVTSWN